MAIPDIRDIEVPLEDAAIQEAMANLDRKLRAHARALRDMERGLPGLTDRPQSPLNESPEPPDRVQPLHESPVPCEPKAAAVPPHELEDMATGLAPADLAQAASATEPSDDEKVLASLDEATSKAVRVMRRLNPGRSIQDLLKQVEKQKDTASTPARPAGKSWFRRK